MTIDVRPPAAPELVEGPAPIGVVELYTELYWRVAGALAARAAMPAHVRCGYLALALRLAERAPTPALRAAAARLVDRRPPPPEHGAA